MAFSTVTGFLRGFLGGNDLPPLSPADLTFGPALSPAEDWFLRKAKRMGLDWKRTRGELAAQHGVSSYYDWAKVVKLPPTTVFSRTPLEFQLYFEGRWENCPPEYLWANYMPHEDSKRNFSEIETQLMEKLGEGVRGDVTNCFKRSWRMGIFEVAVRCWPGELQHPRLPNSLHEKHPRLEAAASVTVTSDLAHVFPDESLTWVAEAMAGRNPDGSRAVMPIPVSRLSSFHDIERSRRNPPALFAAIERGKYVAWREGDSIMGLSVQSSSYRRERDPKSRLLLLHVKPARGPGGSEIYLCGAPPENEKFIMDTNRLIVEHPDISGLDQVARDLAAFWSIPLDIEESYAD